MTPLIPSFPRFTLIVVTQKVNFATKVNDVGGAAGGGGVNNDNKSNCLYLKETVSQNFWLRAFFKNHLFPRRHIISSVLFKLFSKIGEDICDSRCITSGSNAGSQLTTVVDPDGIFIVNVIDTAAFTDHEDTSNKTSVEIFSPLSRTSTITLLPVSLTPVVKKDRNTRLPAP